MKKLAIFLALVAVVFATSCKKLPEFTPSNGNSGGDTPTAVTIPEVATLEATEISENHALLHGVISNYDSSNNYEIGFYCGTTENLDSFLAADDSGHGTFVAKFDGLTANTTYYYKAYAIVSGASSENAGYGEVKSFTTTTQTTTWSSPEPGSGGTIPSSVLPNELYNTVTSHFAVYSGENPPNINGQFVSSPHVLIHSNCASDTLGVFNDRYIAFLMNNGYLDFYGKQWDDDYEAYYEEAYRKLYVVGTGDKFTCYYLTEGYPNGMYAKQSTIFSGKWNESYGGIRDFQVAVILLETSGNPNLLPANSFRIIGDGDGLARDTAWLGTKFTTDDIQIYNDDAFSMFRKR